MKAKLISNKVTILLIAVLFLIWGVSMNLMNSLNTSVSYYLQLDSTQVSLMQIAYYIAYAIAAIPAMIITSKFGYRLGIVSSLGVFVLGCLIVYPATLMFTSNVNTGFIVFLISLFIMSCGSASLESNCNPYITKLGDEKDEAIRINFANGFNGFGSIIGPMIFALLVTGVSADNHLDSFIDTSTEQFMHDKTQFISSLQFIYGLIAIILIIMLIIFLVTRIPSLPCNENIKEDKIDIKSLLSIKKFRRGMLALFCLTGTQLAGMTIIAWYAKEEIGLDLGSSTMLVSIASIALCASRFISLPIIKKFTVENVLNKYMIIASILISISVISPFFNLGMIGLITYIATFFFLAIGYASIISITLKGMKGSMLKAGGCLLTMMMIGGAVFTFIISWLGSILTYNIAIILFIPAIIYMSLFAKNTNYE